MVATWTVQDIATTFYTVITEETLRYSWEDFRSEPRVTPRYPRNTTPHYSRHINIRKPYTKQFTGHKFRVGRDKT